MLICYFLLKKNCLMNNGPVRSENSATRRMEHKTGRIKSNNCNTENKMEWVQCMITENIETQCSVGFLP